MAATTQDLKAILDELGLRYQPLGGDLVVLFFETEVYRNPSGEPTMNIVLGLAEEGRYFMAFVPNAFQTQKEHVKSLLEFCTRAQWHLKLMRLAVDEEDGELRPSVEFPIEDSELTARQVARCIEGLGYFLETYYPAISQILESGHAEESLLPWNAA